MLYFFLYCGFAHQVLLCVLLWSEEDDVTLWGKNTQQKAITGSQDGKNFYSHCVLSRGADIRWNKGNPNSTKNQHAESDEFGLVEVVWKLPGEEGQQEADCSQQANVAQNQREGKC